MKTRKVKGIVQGQCDRCGLVGDRRQYVDGTFQKKCPHCGHKTDFRIIR